MKIEQYCQEKGHSINRNGDDIKQIIAALHLRGVVPSISSKYDCDDCKHFPCHSNQDNYGSKSKPVERGICGDYSIKT